MVYLICLSDGDIVGYTTRFNYEFDYHNIIERSDISTSDIRNLFNSELMEPQVNMVENDIFHIFTIVNDKTTKETNIPGIYRKVK